MLAANVDLALVVEPLPEPNERRLERFVAVAGDVPCALVLTKTDLADDGYEVAARLARRLGVPDGLAVSATSGEGLGPLRALLAPGTTGVILGASGAGKSTLVNALLGFDRQAVGAVRASDGRGRHTTVTRELIALAVGRVADRHARHPRRGAMGRRRELPGHRGARRGLPVRGLRARVRAGLRGPRRRGSRSAWPRGAS